MTIFNTLKIKLLLLLGITVLCAYSQSVQAMGHKTHVRRESHHTTARADARLSNIDCPGDNEIFDAVYSQASQDVFRQLMGKLTPRERIAVLDRIGGLLMRSAIRRGDDSYVTLLLDNYHLNANVVLLYESGTFDRPSHMISDFLRIHPERLTVYINILNALVRHGADLSATNLDFRTAAPNNQNTPLAVAREQYRLETLTTGQHETSSARALRNFISEIQDAERAPRIRQIVGLTTPLSSDNRVLNLLASYVAAQPEENARVQTGSPSRSPTIRLVDNPALRICLTPPRPRRATASAAAAVQVVS